MFSLLPVVLFNNLDSFWCQLPSFGDRDFCLLSNIVGLSGALNVVLTEPQKYI